VELDHQLVECSVCHDQHIEHARYFFDYYSMNIDGTEIKFLKQYRKCNKCGNDNAFICSDQSKVELLLANQDAAREVIRLTDKKVTKKIEKTAGNYFVNLH